jgi:hypothetical protein
MSVPNATRSANCGPVTAMTEPRLRASCPPIEMRKENYQLMRTLRRKRAKMMLSVDLAWTAIECSKRTWICPWFEKEVTHRSSVFNSLHVFIWWMCTLSQQEKSNHSLVTAPSVNMSAGSECHGPSLQHRVFELEPGWTRYITSFNYMEIHLQFSRFLDVASISHSFSFYDWKAVSCCFPTLWWRLHLGSDEARTNKHKHTQTMIINCGIHLKPH